MKKLIKMEKSKNEELHIFTIEEHLAELKSRIIKILLFFVIVTGISLQFSWDIFAFLSAPLSKLTMHDKNFHFIYTKLTEGFITELKIAFVSGLFFTSPFFFFQLYRFLAPGLYKHEKSVIAPYIFFPPILFATGVVLVYFVVIPITWRFFLSFQTTTTNAIPIRLEAKVSEYIDLIIELFIGFGIAFQLPIVLILLTKLQIISYKNLISFRRYAIVLIFIASAILTPPDVLSQLILAVPLMLLYEISIFCCKKTKTIKQDA
jgi:sec-independent protein translocase protein TatC